MPLNWTPDLAVGITIIDDQHKELFLRANLLELAVAKGRSEKELIEIVDFLEGYIVVHFGLEERQMEVHHYHDYATHKAQHNNFIETFMEFRKQYFIDGATAVLAERMKQFVSEWIVTHIQQADKSMAIFLRGRN